jgi:hypothetical protein
LKARAAAQARRRASGTSGTSNTNAGGNYLKNLFVKKCVCELVWFLWFLSKKCLGARIRFSRKKRLTTYKRHQLVITELEIGAVGTDFSRRTSWWEREDPGRARTWKSMKNMNFSEMYTHAKKNTNGSKSYISG